MRKIWTPLTGPVDKDVVGPKAYRLVRMLNAGFRVPAFYVIGANAGDSGALLDAASWASAVQVHERVMADYGAWPVIVRSSSLSEDLACSSAAGQYITVPEVGSSEALLKAINTVLLSQALGWPPAQSWTQGMAVIVQRQIRGEWFGVASLKRCSLSEPVAIEMAAARSAVTDGCQADFTCTINGQGSVEARTDDIGLGASTLRQLASNVRAVAALFAQPVDVEFAISGTEIYLLQARPTSQAAKKRQRTGRYALSLRLGVEEWLTRRVSTLFVDLILPRWESSATERLRHVFRIRRPAPSWVTVDGIYYYRIDLRSTLQTARAALARFNRCYSIVAATPRFFETFFQGEPDYAGLAEGEPSDHQSANLARFLQTVDWTATAYSWLIASGLACRLIDVRIRLKYKFIRAARWWLPKFDDLVIAESARLRSAGGVAGLVDGGGVSIEYRQLDLDPALDPISESDLAALRRLSSASAAEDRRLLSVGTDGSSETPRSRRSAAHGQVGRIWSVYAEQLAIRDYRPLQFQRVYPVLRESIARIQKDLCEQAGELAPDEIFHLTLRELLELSAGVNVDDIVAAAKARKAIWSTPRRSSVSAVAMLARRKPKLVSMLLGRSRVRKLRGRPVSPGRASGRAVVHYDVPDLQRHRPGAILVAPRTTPAWTPLMRTSAAVITETGNVLSHTSITARALGVPAIVGVSGAMTHIADGDWILVDGTEGRVKILRSSAR